MEQFAGTTEAAATEEGPGTMGESAGPETQPAPESDESGDAGEAAAESGGDTGTGSDEGGANSSGDGE